MGSIFALVFVLTTAAAGFLPTPPKDYFDGVRPDMFDGKDSFFQNYWQNLAMASNHRYWNGPVPFSYEYQTRNYMGNDRFTIREIFEKPLIAVTLSPLVPDTFTAFYLHNGLRSLYRFKNLSWLLEYIKTPGMKSLVFFPNYLYNIRFFETPISNVVIQDNCRMSDFFMMSGSSYKVPYMFIGPEPVFDEMHFENIAKVSDLKVHNDIIDVLSSFSWPHNMANSNDRKPGSQVYSGSISAASSSAQAGSVAGTQGPAGGVTSPDGGHSRSLLGGSQAVSSAKAQSVAAVGSVAGDSARSLSSSDAGSHIQPSSTSAMSA